MMAVRVVGVLMVLVLLLLVLLLLLLLLVVGGCWGLRRRGVGGGGVWGGGVWWGGGRGMRRGVCVGEVNGVQGHDHGRCYCVCCMSGRV